MKNKDILFAMTFFVSFTLTQAFLSINNSFEICDFLDVKTPEILADSGGAGGDTDILPLAESPDWSTLHYIEKMTPMEMLIWEEAEKANVNPSTAIRIAKCESSLNPKVKHKISSASGLYMFIDKTWANHCIGDRMNAEDNLRCFLKLYPQFPDWWECK